MNGSTGNDSNAIEKLGNIIAELRDHQDRRLEAAQREWRGALEKMTEALHRLDKAVEVSRTSSETTASLLNAVLEAMKGVGKNERRIEALEDSAKMAESRLTWNNRITVATLGTLLAILGLAAKIAITGGP